MKLKDLQTICLKQNRPFVSWRLPGSKEIFNLFPLPDQIHFLHDLSTLQPEPGFIFYPFSLTEKRPGIFISGRVLPFGSEPDFIVNRNEEGVSRFADDISDIPGETRYEEYHKAFVSLKELIRSNHLEKVVLARTKQVFNLQRSDLPEIFLLLEKEYPSAFVYLLSLPGCGIWAGATPELLFGKDDHTGYTVALAGTRQGRIEHDHWGAKELHEQEVVSRYIGEVLQENGFKYDQQGPVTIHAGHLAHLKTLFQFQIGPGIPFDLIGKLHPTPAVCGLPVKKAHQAIEKFENLDRSYYCGFLGPVEQNNHTGLFVNLRCLHYRGETGLLFAGGGLTEGSEVNREWEETEQKTKTLLSVIEKLQKLA
jgi:isochorismate synthase